MYRNFFFVLVIFLCLPACNEKSLFSRYVNFSDSWKIDEKIIFKIDSIIQKPVNLIICLRNNNLYPFSNIFLIASLKKQDSLLLCDTLEYQMADPEGKWLGSGFLEVKESKLLWKENFEFPKNEKIEIEIEQATRFNGKKDGVNNLEGILGVGFSIEKTD